MTEHPRYPERTTQTLTHRGTTMPGWFTGPACIWTGGATPRCIGPFDDVLQAMEYAADRHPGAGFFPYSKPYELEATDLLKTANDFRASLEQPVN